MKDPRPAGLTGKDEELLGGLFELISELPEEVADNELKAMGVDPEALVDRGLEFIAKLKEKNRVNDSFPAIGDPPFGETGKDTAVQELRDAGFPQGSEVVLSTEHEVYRRGSEADVLGRMGITIPSICMTSAKEWVRLYEVAAALYGWKFERAWRYWICSAEDPVYAIPQDLAEKLNLEMSDQVRVDGFAGGQEVSRAVCCYHVDTPAGLARLVQVLKEVNDPAVGGTYGS
jgi:hypothetical protein